MDKKLLRKELLFRLLPHFIAVTVFLIVAAVFCRPALEGKVLSQPDVIQWKGMAQSSLLYKEKNGHFPLWTNSMFSGMPAYQIAMEPDNPVTPNLLFDLLTLRLPKPMCFFFLACVCFYFLSGALGIEPYIGIIGSLAYAYATYNTGIIVAGHESKMNAIALLPALLASLILIYEKKYLWGTAFTALFTSLIVVVNHFQIVYYALIVAFFMTGGYIIRWIRMRDFRHLLTAGILAISAGAFGVFSNAVLILTTLDASNASIRGGSELSSQPDSIKSEPGMTESGRDGLGKDYALSFSMKPIEPLVLLVPEIYGGSGTEISEKLKNSRTEEALQSMPRQLSDHVGASHEAYWGGIGPLAPAAPNYAGGIIFFLAIMGFFVLDGKYKWWILAACIASIIMSWGSYFPAFNSWLLDILPMYNKFRAPSMIILIPTLLLCVMAVLSLKEIVNGASEISVKPAVRRKFKHGLLFNLGILALLLLFYYKADFLSASDRLVSLHAGHSAIDKEYLAGFFSALKEDRRELFLNSLLRSFAFITVAAFILWLHLRQKIPGRLSISLVGILAIGDIISIDSQYLNADNYQLRREYDQANFAPTPADRQILQDTGYFRVFDLRDSLETLSYGAMTSYFHNSIGGYHAAKLSIYEDLLENQLEEFPQSMPVVNMLNAKYFIRTGKDGRDTVLRNKNALGPAWFVRQVKFEPGPQEVMNALTGFHPKDTAIAFTSDKNLVSFQKGIVAKTDSIRLIRNDNDEIWYTTHAGSPRFAVFSEVYYDKGWKAFIDNKEVPVIRTDYVLRGVSVPAGNHLIHFIFHPQSFYTGEKVERIVGVLVLLLLILALLQGMKKGLQRFWYA